MKLHTIAPAFASVATSFFSLVLVVIVVLPNHPDGYGFAESSAISHFAIDDPYDKKACVSAGNDVPNPHPEPDARAPDHFYVELPTTAAGPTVVLEVNRTWAPIGADRFHALVSDHYYDCAGLFRVVPGFIVQWGIAADPNETTKWNTAIPDDPVLESVSNAKGTVSFATAGPDTRTTQVFVNLEDNSFLDGQGFAPFAKVVKGMEILDGRLYVASPVPDQGTYEQEGNAWLLEAYPDVDIVRGLPQDAAGKGATTRILLSWEDEDKDEEPQPEQTPTAIDSSSGSAVLGPTSLWQAAMAAAWLVRTGLGW